MKQCISRIITIIIRLWRTLKKYVCKQEATSTWIIKVPIQDGEVKLTFQRSSNIQPSLEGSFIEKGSAQNSNIKGGILSDGESDSILESTGNDALESSEGN